MYTRVLPKTLLTGIDLRSFTAGHPQLPSGAGAQNGTLLIKGGEEPCPPLYLRTFSVLQDYYS
jgi:hypothetical protein